jgi:hypothetical protein
MLACEVVVNATHEIIRSHSKSVAGLVTRFWGTL